MNERIVEWIILQFFDKHPIQKLEDGKACQIYIEMLLNIVRLDKNEEITLNRLVFIH